MYKESRKTVSMNLFAGKDGDAGVENRLTDTAGEGGKERKVKSLSCARL